MQILQPQRIRLIGLPGTGKTTKLISILGELLNKYSIDKIIFCSFTNAAVDEAKVRIIKQFDVDPTKMIWFNTLHSNSFKLINNRKIKEMSDLKPFFSEFKSKFDFSVIRKIYFDYGSKFNLDSSELVENEQLMSLDQLLEDGEKWLINVDNYLKESYPLIYQNDTEIQEILIQLFYKIGVKTYHQQLLKLYLQFRNFLMLYKIKYKYFDFNDILLEVLRKERIPDADVLIVDEFQDCSRLQYMVTELWGKYMREFYVAGDPNQSIFGFNGASPKFLNEFEPSDNCDLLLAESYRLPSKIVEFSKLIISDKWVNSMTSKNGRIGDIKYQDYQKINFYSYQSVLVLARTNYIVKKVKNKHRPLTSLSFRQKQIVTVIDNIYQGRKLHKTDIEILIEMHEKNNFQFLSPLLYQELRDWLNLSEPTSVDSIELSKFLQIEHLSKEDDEFIKFLQNVLENGYKKNKIDFMTIHQSKGKEADLVVIINLGNKYENEDIVDKDEEQRVYYVAVTRAKQKLIIANFDLPGYFPTNYLPEMNEYYSK